MNLDPEVRFVTILNLDGAVVHRGQREGTQNYLDSMGQLASIQHALESWHLRSDFAEQIGRTHYALAVYDKIKRYTFPIDETHLLYITTGPEISPESFIQDVLKTLETFKKA